MSEVGYLAARRWPCKGRAYMVQASRARSTTSVIAASAAAFTDACVMDVPLVRRVRLVSADGARRRIRDAGRCEIGAPRSWVLLPHGRSSAAPRSGGQAWSGGGGGNDAG